MGMVPFIFPNLKEQQKIASFLSSVDEWIGNLKKQKEELEKYKKGMMQKIFPAPGGQISEIRFKDDEGNDFAEWEEKKLGETIIIIMGQSPDFESYNANGVGVHLIQGNADISNRTSAPRNWTTQPTKMCNPGDILLTVRAPVGTVAKSFHKACIGRGVCAIRNTEKSDNNFLYQFLLMFEKRWVKYEQGSTFTAINTNDIKRLKVLIPTLEEQQKIAEFLTSLDNLIESKQKEIEFAEDWKKGLMQRMFV
jgi:type I restriction enzyme S subunit